MADKERERQQFGLKKLELEREIRELELQTAREIREIQKWGIKSSSTNERRDSGNRLPRWLQEAAIGSPSFTNSPYDFKSLVYGLNGQTAIALNVDEEGNLRTIGDGGEGVDLPRALFEDIRVAPFTPDIGWTFPYTVNSLIVNPITTGTGSVTQANGSAVLGSGGGANSTASIQTRRFLRFSTGLSIRAVFHATFSTGVSGSRQIIGFGDALDGLYFGFNGAQFGILVRSNGVDQWINQADWNMDPLDGTGESGFTMDPTMGNIYVIRRLGSEFGAVQFYIFHPATANLLPIHRIVSANQTDIPTIRARNLPLRAEVANLANTNSRVLRTVWGLAGVEGIANQAIVTRHSFYFSKSLSSNTETNIFTIRNKVTIDGAPNRTPISLLMISAATDEGNRHVTINIRTNATLTGAITYTDIDTRNSVISYNTTGVYTAGTGTLVLPLQLGRSDSRVVDLTPLDLPLSTGETITITALTTGTNAVCNVGLSWMEYY